MTGLRVVVFFLLLFVVRGNWRHNLSCCSLFWSYGFMTSHLLQLQTQEEFHVSCFISRCDINCRTSSTSPPLSLSLRAGSRHIVANTFIWVISPSIVPRANQIITKAPNFDLRLWHCHLRVQPLICLAFWHKVFESGEIRILLGSVIDWKSISQSAAEADKSNKLFPVLLSISIITANTLMDKRATRSHLLTLHEATICRFLIRPVV